jgi:outer membrane biosynthesis protein TonB
VLRGARTAQLSGDNQIISKSGAQALVDAGLLSPEDALVPVVANARARELLDLGPDGVYELMTSQPVEVEVEEQAAAPTTRPVPRCGTPEVEETVEVEVEEQTAAPTTRPVPRPEVEETVEVEVEDRRSTPAVSSVTPSGDQIGQIGQIGQIEAATDRATTVPRTGTSTETATRRTVTGGTEVTPSEDAVAAIQVEDPLL